MTTHVKKLALLGLMISAGFAPAALAQDVAATPAATQETAPADAAPVDAVAPQGEETTALDASNPLGSMGDFDFEKMQFDNLEMQPNGNIRMVGGVNIKSDLLDLESDEVIVNKETKIMTAKGNPVRIRTQNYEADCKNLTHDMDKKTYKLEGNPHIWQTVNGSTTKISGDIINLFQDEKGAMGVSISRDKNNPQQAIIEKTGGDKKKDKGTTTAAKGTTGTGAKKVTGANTELIKTPEIN